MSDLRDTLLARASELRKSISDHESEYVRLREVATEANMAFMLARGKQKAMRAEYQSITQALQHNITDKAPTLPHRDLESVRGIKGHSYHGLILSLLVEQPRTRSELWMEVERHKPTEFNSGSMMTAFSKLKKTGRIVEVNKMLLLSDDPRIQEYAQLGTAQ